MKILCNRIGLLDAFSKVSGVIPAKSPKPIIQCAKLTVTEDGSTLMGTDLEVGIRHTVPGVKIDRPGSVILPTAQIGQILRTSTDEELSIEADGERLVVRGLNSEFKLSTEDPDLFPEVPDFTADAYHVITPGNLRTLIRRTAFATDVESTRYALGGVLVEVDGSTLSMVGTDGRRLAKQSTDVEAEGKPGWPSHPPVIPLKALKLIDRNIDDDDPPVHLAFPGSSAVLIRTAEAVIYSRLVEGRFPRYQDVFPAAAAVKVTIEAGPFLGAIAQAQIATSNESRGIDFEFSNGTLRLTANAADIGASRVELPIDYDGQTIAITFDPRYLVDALKTIEADESVTIDLIDGKSAAVLRTEDNFTYIAMPLTREK